MALDLHRVNGIERLLASDADVMCTEQARKGWMVVLAGAGVSNAEAGAMRCDSGALPAMYFPDTVRPKK